MRAFMDEHFLLKTPAAQKLYHEYAEHMPIIDYHCHISPQQIAEDLRYDNIAQPFLGGDHYKWRLIRACGVSEELITGSADDYDKFLAFAKSLPMAVGNPVYHWTHLELKRYFGCDEPLNEDTASAIWDHCNKVLKDGLTVRQMILKANVTGLATTDDPADSLVWHEKIKADPSFDVTVRPAWRPDRFVNLRKQGFLKALSELGTPESYEELKAELIKRMDHFALHGCCAADHGIVGLTYAPAGKAVLEDIYKRAAAGETVSYQDEEKYRWDMLSFFAREYSRRGWVMQIHYGARRDNRTSFFERLGPDTGYDSIDPSCDVSGLAPFLDMLDLEQSLPKTILFSLDGKDNLMLSTLAGCFQREGVRGAVQQGAAWWFNDSLKGMKEHILTMAQTQNLGCFVGMVTDSRSFLSYTRHEYFRRLLCDILGDLVFEGQYPADYARLGRIVQDICYNNVREFFGYEK